MPEVLERGGNAVVAPRGVFLREADNQILDFTIDFGAPGVRALLRAVELLSDEPAVPCQDRVRLDAGRDYRR